MLAKTKENIKADYYSLIGNFDKKIAELAQLARQKNRISRTVTNELNTLKLERIKLNQHWSDMDSLAEKEVLAQQGLFEQYYNNAITILAQPSGIM